MDRGALLAGLIDIVVSLEGADMGLALTILFWSGHIRNHSSDEGATTSTETRQTLPGDR